jgi:hypothetical protein
MTAKKDKDDLIIGKKMLEEFFRKSIDVLINWKAGFGLPLVRRGGFPTISKSEFNAWAREWDCAEIAPSKITAEHLDKVTRRKKIAEIPNTILEGIDEIKKIFHRPNPLVNTWIRDFEDCPIRKERGSYTVGKRDLIQWLEKHRIQWGHYPGESRR